MLDVRQVCRRRVQREAGDGCAVGLVGVVLGFVAALLAMAWERKRSRRQSANTYPPVVSLRKLGWSFISD